MQEFSIRGNTFILKTLINFPWYVLSGKKKTQIFLNTFNMKAIKIISVMKQGKALFPWLSASKGKLQDKLGVI